MAPKWNGSRYTLSVPLLQPMPLAVARAAFSHPDWIFDSDRWRIDGGRFLMREPSAYLLAEYAFCQFRTERWRE